MDDNDEIDRTPEFDWEEVFQEFEQVEKEQPQQPQVQPRPRRGSLGPTPIVPTSASSRPHRHIQPTFPANLSLNPNPNNPEWPLCTPLPTIRESAALCQRHATPTPSLASFDNRPHAAFTITSGTQWYSSDSRAMHHSAPSAYGSTSNFPAMQPESKPNKTVKHKRGYQACDQCRKRKTGCQLGDDVDNPGEPPCNRCRREGKKCTFAPTRKKRTSSATSSRPRVGSSSSDLPSAGDLPTHPTIPRSQYSSTPHTGINIYSSPTSPFSPSAQRPHVNPTSHPAANPTSHPSSQPYSTSPYTQGMASSSSGAQRRATASGESGGSQVRSDLAARAFVSDAPTTQENMDVLTAAAATVAKRDEQSEGLQSPSSTFTPSSAGHRGTIVDGMASHSISSRLGSGVPADAKESADYSMALKTWGSMRFVRAGWFTADEAMSYIEFFYAHQATMTPISLPNFRQPSTHHTLLTEEPVLAIAILMIASRHMRLSGHAALTRAARIHDKLWDYLRNMLERLLWGQEQFGGGFCAAGTIKVQESHSGQLTWKGSLRTLGTVEALLLLTDWQPRALHFPPGDGENRLLDTSYNFLSDANDEAIDDSDNEDARQGRPYGAWLEPTWRSDRMSWMLLGLAQALSFELGVFDNNHFDCSNDHDANSICARKRRVRRMVLVYVSQTSGRLGLPSMLPLPEWSTDENFERTYKQQSRGQSEDPIDTMQSFWLDIALIMYNANKELFPSRNFTRNLTATDEYKTKIAEFKPRLQMWKIKFDRLKTTLHPLMQHVLAMEYEYARCYINSLGLQKVIESWVLMPGHENNGTNGGPDQQSRLRELYSPNHEYIEEVADSARMILQSVVDGLAPGGNLRNAPVRTFLRSISGMMFTLKRFGVGAFEDDVRQSIDLLDRCTDLMERDIVDDVHLSSQIAGLIKLLVANIRKTFIRVQGKENGSEAVSNEQSRQETPQQSTAIRRAIQHSNGDSQAPAPKRARMSTNTRHRQLGDPLEDIQALPMEDLTNFTFMLPPNHYSLMNGEDGGMPMDANGDASMMDPMNMMSSTDWFTLPLNNLWNASTTTVNQGNALIGPTLGDRDLLEVFTEESYDQVNPFNMQGMNFMNNNNSANSGGYNQYHQ